MEQVNLKGYQISGKAAHILSVMPVGGEVTSSELEMRLPYTAKEIGATISNDLYMKYVTRRRPSSKSEGAGWIWIRTR